MPFQIKHRAYLWNSWCENQIISALIFERSVSCRKFHFVAFTFIISTQILFLWSFSCFFFIIILFFERGRRVISRKNTIVNCIDLISYKKEKKIGTCYLFYFCRSSLNYQSLNITVCPLAQSSYTWHAKKKKKKILCPFLFQLLMIAGVQCFPLGPKNAHLKNRPDVHGGCQPQFMMQ